MATEGVPQAAIEAAAHVLEPGNADIHYYGGDPADRAEELVRAILKLAAPILRQQVLAEVREVLLLDDGPRLAADAVWTEIDGPLGRASMDESFKKLGDRGKDAIRFITGAAAALATLSNEETD